MNEVIEAAVAVKDWDRAIYGIEIALKEMEAGVERRKELLAHYKAQRAKALIDLEEAIRKCQSECRRVACPPTSNARSDSTGSRSHAKSPGGIVLPRHGARRCTPR